MKTKVMPYLGLAIFLIFGCATYSEPKTENDKLLTGIIVHTGIGYKKYSGATVNGIHKTGIEMTIKNVSTNEEFKIRTKKNGLFYLHELPVGTYEIEDFYLKVSSGKAWADTHSSPDNRLRFSIENGKVNNLGVINWDGKMREWTNISFNNSYNTVMKEFTSRFPKSNWLKMEVINLNIKKN